MPNIDIRSLVMKNLSGSSSEDMLDYVQDAVDSREEATLPGMGILFELVWKKSDEQEKDQMIGKIIEEVNNVTVP